MIFPVAVWGDWLIMRRLLVFVTALVPVLTLVAPAQADQTVVVRSMNFDATPYYQMEFGCDESLPSGQPVLQYIAKDSPAPVLGTRSWSFAPQVAGEMWGMSAAVATSAELAALQIRVYGDTAPVGHALVVALPPGTPDGDVWYGFADVTGAAGDWATVDASGLTYTWKEYSNGAATGVTSPDGTINEFVAAKGESTQGYAGGIGFGCDGAQFWYDEFAYGSAGNVTTLDMEAIRYSISMSAAHTTVTAGQSVNLSGTITGNPCGSLPVALQRKRFDAAAYSKLADVTAAALLGDPEVLLLDEPANGLDPEGMRWIRQFLQRLAAEGRTVFISSHVMSEMQQIAEHLVVIGRGRLIADCPVAEFVSRGAGQRVRVRSPQLDALRRLIAEAGGSAEPDGPAMTVSGLAPEAIGELAATHSVVLHELTPVGASLEEAFMQLTSESVEYHGAEADA